MADDPVLQLIQSLENRLDKAEIAVEENSRTLTAEQRSYYWRHLGSVATLVLAIMGGGIGWFLVDTAEDTAEDTAKTRTEQIAVRITEDVSREFKALRSEVDLSLETFRLEAAQIARTATSEQIARDIVESPEFVEEAGSKLAELLPNAVVAFDSNEGCPEGWADLSKVSPERFSRRVIVGVDHADTEKTLFGYLEVGGKERHTLTISEMPGHDHSAGTLRADQLDNLMYKSQSWTDRGTNPADAKRKGVLFPVPRDGAQLDHGAHDHKLAGTTDTKGAGQPHNNMPPYIALYFCKKE